MIIDLLHVVFSSVHPLTPFPSHSFLLLLFFYIAMHDSFLHLLHTFIRFPPFSFLP